MTAAAMRVYFICLFHFMSGEVKDAIPQWDQTNEIYCIVHEAARGVGKRQEESVKCIAL